MALAIKRCLYCKKILKVDNHSYVYENRKFCSRKCMGLFWRGKNNPKWKLKIIRYCIICGKKMELQKCWIKRGKSKGLFCSRKCFAQWRSENKSGKDSWNWKGGLSLEPYGAEFNNKLKKHIRKRDNYTCQECGYTEEKLGHKLSIHHIDYCKTHNEPNNLISLCKSCHLQTNYKREDWTKYFQGSSGGTR